MNGAKHYSVDYAHRTVPGSGGAPGTEVIDVSLKAESLGKYFANNDPVTVNSASITTMNVFVRNIFEGKKIKIQKLWDDNNNADGQRPEILDITLNEFFKLNSENKTDSLTKQLKNSESWGRDVLLPRYYYNGDSPVNVVHFSVTENLSASHRYYDVASSPTLQQMGYVTSDQGYIINGSPLAESEKDKYIFSSFGDDKLGTSDESFVGLYIVNRKDNVNSKLTFTKEWEDNNSWNSRPDSIYIKTVRRTKGTVQAGDNNIFRVSPEQVDFDQDTIFENLPFTVGEGENKHNYVYFLEPKNTNALMTTEENGETLNLRIRFSGTKAVEFTLKRRITEYPALTISPDESGLFKVPTTMQYNQTASVRFRDLDISDGTVNYEYKITNASTANFTMTSVPTTEGKKDIIVTARTNGSDFTFMLKRSNSRDESGTPNYQTIPDTVAELYYDETVPLLLYTPSEGYYTIPSDAKYGDIYSLKISGLEEGTYRLVDSDNTSFNTSFSGSAENGYVVNVRGVENDLIFKLQKKNTDNDGYSDVVLTDVTVGRYYEETVTTDINGTKLRLEYFQKNPDTTDVKTDSYGNTIGYEDTSMSYTGTSGSFSIPDSDAYKIDETNKKFSVLVKGLNRFAVSEYTYTLDSVTGAKNTVISCINKNDGAVDLIVTAYAVENTNFTFRLKYSGDGGTTSEYYNDVKTAVDSQNSSITSASSEGVFTLGSGFVHDNSYSVTISGLPAYLENTYTVSDGTYETRIVGHDKVDVLVEKTVGIDDTSSFDFVLYGGNASQVSTAVRFFKADTSGIVQIPKEANVTFAENLDYGVSKAETILSGTDPINIQPSQTANGLAYKYYLNP